ncbi:DUF6538 domain-containing protein [Mesorhizobium sp.]|uniref:DUF6538 domain-containing protein n=1 Tax=Mesorhizobium sp. TaxID=1871066 RepID=UPI0025C3D745|nr:DUF6538 domain-containing protein [Mesorhizobium sp.]
MPIYRTTTRKKSLRTKDEATAKTRLWPVIEGWRAEFDDMRARRELTADDKADAVWQHYTDALQRDDQARLYNTNDQDDGDFDRPSAKSLRQFEAKARRAKLGVRGQ